MSNLSDIGFPVATEQDVNQVIMDVLPHLSQIPCPPRGYYYKFEDESGAQLYLQGNDGQDIIGFNPAFNGRSTLRAGLVLGIDRDTSELDGAFKGWVNPTDDSDIENSGLYPIVFDVPDFRLFENTKLQTVSDVQVTAFASNDLVLFESEAKYNDSRESEPGFAVKSFVPSGLFAAESASAADNGAAHPPQAHAFISGEIIDFDLRTNSLTGKQFYWFLVETLGGQVDVVADPVYIKNAPEKGAIIKGSFWLSGKILEMD